MQSQKQLVDVVGKFYPKIVKMDSGSSKPWREKERRGWGIKRDSKV